MKLEHYVTIAWIYVTLNIMIIGVGYHKPIPVDWIIIFIILASAVFHTIRYEIKEKRKTK